MAEAYTVTQINSYIRHMFQQDFVLNKISISGEVSNCKYHSSGHIYFTLKDSSSAISVIMFSSQAVHMSFRLKEGMKIIARGRIEVYERDGKYQLYANEIKQDGEGDLYRKFEELKRELEEMGMFSAQYKQKIPEYATTIGIVTAETGAAIQDIIHIAKRRNPYVQLILYPALVQGEGAKYSIVNGINELDKRKPDIIIVGRGGGSIEDLWAFNEEIVARAIFNCTTPIISAVGHETDFTIADFVADLRAPTPSAAAELAVPELSLVFQRIESYEYHLKQFLGIIVAEKRNQLEKYKLQINYLNPSNQLNEKRQRCMEIEQRLQILFTNILHEKKHNLEILSERLNGLSPLGKLKQGYAYVESEDGKTVHSIEDIDEKDNVVITLADGKLAAMVTGKEKK